MIPFERSRPEGCPSDLRFDRLLAGELAPAEAQATRAHLDGCARCAGRFAALEAGRAAFLADPPPLRLPAAPRATAPAVQRPRARPLFPARALFPAVTAALGAAAALAAVLFVNRSPAPPAEPRGDERGAGLAPAEPATRIKGSGGRIGFYVARGEVVSPGGPGEVVHPNDRLQFTYSTAEAGYFALLSVDGAGKGSIYFPAGDVAAPIQPGEGVPLPSSVVLDGTLGAEVLYGLFCDASVALEPLRAALEAAPERPPAPAGCRVDRVSLDKRAAP
ncbi:zf-HC2 domain-containing protein [Sorangium sp. So ce854]|uniref:zf-HC2 domain-containing protein n=1 Tax=Sorangium sp. So ce854 TaxID=3133322 RepID=UPI003F646846